MVDLRDGTSVEDPRLDRLEDFNPGTLNYPLCAVLTDVQQEPCTKRWYPPPGTVPLDQGVEGACVGAGIANDLRFYPVAVRGIDMTYAREQLYWPAQRGDQWDGGAYPDANPRYDGTSVHAGMQVAAALGHYGEYRWAKTEPEMALGVSHVGPAIIGVNWYPGMFKPNAQGFVSVTGTKAGGHCILVVGINIRGGYYTLYNSWGPAWGNNGTAKITRTDMARLLAENGECCLVTERLSGPKR